MKHRSRLEILIKAINRWLELPKTSRSIITSDIVVAVAECGLTEILEKEGITFNLSDDPYNDMRVNAQKIFRWLGQYEGTHAFPDRLFYIEPAILKAMPEEIRLEYLNSVYGVTDVYIGAKQKKCNKINAEKMAKSINKEHSEAMDATLELGNSPSNEKIITAHRELMESAATSQGCAERLENNYPQLFNNDNLAKIGEC